MTDAERITELEGSLTRLRSVLDEYEKRLLPRVSELERSVDEYKKLVRLLQEENERLKRGLLGQKAERFSTNDAQLSLSMLEMAFASGEPVSDGSPETEQIIAEYTRGKAKRKPFPESLPRVKIEVLPIEVQKEGLDAFELVGSDVHEVLERRAPSTVSTCSTATRSATTPRSSGTRRRPAATQLWYPPHVVQPRRFGGGRL